MSIVIYTDGACAGNNSDNMSLRRAGWAVVVVENDFATHQLSGMLTGTEISNNRAELTALIKALEFIKVNQISDAKIIIDSEYALKGATEWLPGWINRNWKNANKKPVANRDLWEMINQLLNDVKSLNVSYEWTRGHNGNRYNELADQLAVAAYQ